MVWHWGNNLKQSKDYQIVFLYSSIQDIQAKFFALKSTTIYIPPCSSADFLLFLFFLLFMFGIIISLLLLQIVLITTTTPPLLLPLLFSQFFVVVGKVSTHHITQLSLSTTCLLCFYFFLFASSSHLLFSFPFNSHSVVQIASGQGGCTEKHGFKHQLTSYEFSSFHIVFKSSILNSRQYK